MKVERQVVQQQEVRTAARLLLLGVIGILAAACASPASSTGEAGSPPAGEPSATLSSAYSEELAEATPTPADPPPSEAVGTDSGAALTASATPFPISPTPTELPPTGSLTASPNPRTYTPTSMPGPATLIAPADGATLPQPVAPSQWTFSWSGRTGPCYSTITIQGPGGRRLGSGYIPWQNTQGYSYTYSTTEPLPDDALGPWAWFVEIHCPGGTSRSLTRTFRVAAGPPIPTTPAVTPPSPTPTRGTPTVVPTQPGLIVRGAVRREDGTGLASVTIIRAFAGYAGEVVATTGPDGSYVSAFQYIPGDETVRVWAQAPGYTFSPASSTSWDNGTYIWRHYYGREDRTLNFVAVPAFPPPTVQPGLIIRGTVRREDGTGLPNVSIYRAFAGYSGVVVATTGPDGSYASAFQYIPGDETVRVWAEASGYVFLPASDTWWEDGEYTWRHYYGREDHTLDFVASRGPTASPTATLRATTSPSITPTSIPGPPALIEPADGATLPQPVAPNEWVFSWSGRTGPCSSFIRIDGPGGRQIGYAYVNWQGSGYTYRYSAPEPLPDDALWPWNWSVEIRCPAGSSRSVPRTFRVMSATPAPTPVNP